MWHIHTLMRQQFGLCRNACGISGQTAAGSYHPVTGNDDRNGIMSYSAAYSLT